MHMKAEGQPRYLIRGRENPLLVKERLGEVAPVQPPRYRISGRKIPLLCEGEAR